MAARPDLYKDKNHGPLFAALGVVGFVANLLVLFLGKEVFGDDRWKLFSQFSLGAWVLLPALWFFYEYFYFFPKHAKEGATYEQLKGVQDASAKVWVAVAAVLAGIYG